MIADNWSYSGNAIGGILTLTHLGGAVAHIRLSGDFRTSKFTVGSDGGIGTLITDPTPALTQAMAEFGAAGGEPSGIAANPRPVSPPLFAAPHG